MRKSQYKTKEDGQGSAVTAWLKRAGEEYARDLGTYAMVEEEPNSTYQPNIKSIGKIIYRSGGRGQESAF